MSDDLVTNSRRCSIQGCEGRHTARGWCNKHYRRWQKFGDPRHTERPMRGMPETERFWINVEKTDSCWLWTGRRHPTGYGTFTLSSDGGNAGHDRQVRAHRYSYELLVGPIPEGMTLDHACHTRVVATCRVGSECKHRACVRPDHLEPATLSENAKRGGHGTRTHCIRGHEFTPENTRLRPPTSYRKYAHRVCRICEHTNRANWRKRTAEARHAA